MSSSEEVQMVAAPRGGKLCLDSEQDERLEQQQKEYEQQIRRKKEEKRKRREEAQRIEKEKILQEELKQKKYQDPEVMFEEDSEDGIEFKRVLKKIRKAYPDMQNRHEIRKKNDFIADSEEDSEQQSEEESESRERKVQKKKKIQKREKRPEKRPQKKPVEKKIKPEVPPVKKEKVKVEHSDKKENLVRQVSIRWWYALPPWPPVDYDYEAKLKELGYRNVKNATAFANEPEVVDGLYKVYPLDGYLGYFRTKTKLIDVRPKESAPTLNNFRNMSTSELNRILVKALTVQMEQLKLVKHRQLGEDDLMTDMERQLNRLQRTM